MLSKLNVLLCALLLLPAIAHADTAPLTLDQTMRLAVERQPMLRSLGHAASAAREAAVAEAQLPDPRLRFGVQNLPINGANAYRFDREDMTMTTLGVMQDVVRSEKREAASRRMQAEAEQIDSEQIASARGIRRDAALAWLDAYEAQRKAEVYRRMAGEMTAERQVALSRLAAGGASGEVFQLDTMLAMANDKRLAAERDERKARAMLARWIGEAASGPLAADLPEAAPPADRSPARIDQHPALETARRMQGIALADVDRAKAERLQNWGWEMMYGKRQRDRADMLTFQVSLDLPWDRANRQDRRTAEKFALAERANELAEDRRRELTAELDSTWADWDAAQARLQEHEHRLIPAARARYATRQAAYSAGGSPLGMVWEARRSVLEVELEHWVILVERQRAAIRLAYLTDSQEYKK
ncbi:MAG: TolC family protein [Hydrogenophilales bacterium]|nr:TolC family protein [Hydrogenophilales bacterium]